jgi:alkylation response protein AidB-like acyl-CoA dehydrogenase
LEATCGLTALGSAPFILEAAEIPEDALVGEPGEARSFLKRLRARRWVGAAALALGIGRAVLEESLRHTKESMVGGKSAFSAQGVQWRLADMALGLDAAELLVLKAAWLEGCGKAFERESAMAGMTASETVMKSSLEGLQILGEEGCAKGSPMERHMRDAKMVQVFHGSGETLRSVVCGHLAPGARRST